ncbi:MAG TPA: hypothetical protein VG755_31190 [Nannocystaceae bacterium]|nr:hypothetical protein [Nannocystaceae bacterium]
MTDEGRARALLDALVRASSPPPETSERALALVESRIVAGEVEAAPRRRGGELVRAAGLAIAIAAAVLLVVRLAVWSVRELGESPARESASDVVDPPRNEETREAPPASIATPPTIAPTHDTSAPPVAPQSAPVRAPGSTRAPTLDASQHDAPPVVADDLAAEAVLIRAAKSTSDDRGALVLLERHAQRFPNGTLAREREMLRAERLCALGRRDDALAVAQRFLADGQDDPLARRMRKVCTAP